MHITWYQLTWYFTWTLLENEPPQSQCDNDDDNDGQENAQRYNWKKQQQMPRTQKI